MPSTSVEERLWNRVYDRLKLASPQEVEVYERILSSELVQEEATSTTATPSNSNVIGQTGEQRWRQMKELVQAGLRRTQKEAAIKKGIEDKLQVIQAVSQRAEKAIMANPKAAVAWVGVSSGLEVTAALALRIQMRD